MVSGPGDLPEATPPRWPTPSRVPVLHSHVAKPQGGHSTPPPRYNPFPPNLLHCAVLSCLMGDAGAGVLAVFFVVEGSRGSPGRTWRERRPTPQFPRGSPDPQGVRRESTSGLEAAAWYLNRHPPT